MGQMITERESGGRKGSEDMDALLPLNETLQSMLYRVYGVSLMYNPSNLTGNFPTDRKTRSVPFESLLG